jgi:hypothetical protein
MLIENYGLYKRVLPVNGRKQTGCWLTLPDKTRVFCTSRKLTSKLGVYRCAGIDSMGKRALIDLGPIFTGSVDDERALICPSVTVKVCV